MSAAAAKPATQPAAKPTSPPFRYPVNPDTDSGELLKLLGFLLAEEELKVTRFNGNGKDWHKILYIARDYCGDDAGPLVVGWSAGDPAYKEKDIAREWWRLFNKGVVKADTNADIKSLLAMAKPAGAAEGYWRQWLKSHDFKRTDQGVIEHKTGDLPEATQAMVKRGHDILERYPNPKTGSDKPTQSASETLRDALKVWAVAAPADQTNPYLASKQLAAADGLRQASGFGTAQGLGVCLQVPYFNGQGETINLQQVAPGDGRKRFLEGVSVPNGSYATVTGCPLRGGEQVVTISEGIGDALSISQACSDFSEPPRAVVAGMLCRMVGAIHRVRELCPGATILVCADLDKAGGMADEAAILSACTQARAAAILPRFEGRVDKEKPDFADLRQIEGDSALRKQIREGLELALKAKEQGSLLAPAGEPAGEQEAEEAEELSEFDKIMANMGYVMSAMPIIQIEVTTKSWRRSSDNPNAPRRRRKSAEFKQQYAAPVQGYYAPHRIMVEGPGGEAVQKKIYDVWFNSQMRKSYRGLVFLPEGGKVSPAVDGNKALPEPDEDGNLNMFIGTAVAPIKGDCQLILDHLKRVWCADNEELYDYVIKWIAYMFQYPEEQGHTTLSVRGGQGSGKGIITENLLAEIWGVGTHAKIVTQPKDVTAQFNKEMATSIFVSINEGVFSGDKSVAGDLKAKITDAYMKVEPKNVDSYMAANCMHIIITSNYDWIVPVELGDRRYVTLETKIDHITDHIILDESGKTDEARAKARAKYEREKAKAKERYDTALADCIDNGGREAFLHEMLHINLKGFNPRVIPECGTATRFESLMKSLDPVQQWWYQELMLGEISALTEYRLRRDQNDIPETYRQDWEAKEIKVRKDIILERFTKYLRDSWQNRKMEDLPSITRKLKEVCPELISDGKLDGYMVSWNEQRPRCYVFPSLKACRTAFEEVVRWKIEW